MKKMNLGALGRGENEEPTLSYRIELLLALLLGILGVHH